MERNTVQGSGTGILDSVINWFICIKDELSTMQCQSVVAVFISCIIGPICFLKQQNSSLFFSDGRLRRKHELVHFISLLP